jgi:CDP-paratose 2-epimerase
MHEFYLRPRCAEVYNLGGGKANSCSILEAFQTVESLTGTPQRWSYVDQNRAGDHICYYSDLTKMTAHYPNWRITKCLEHIFEEIVEAWSKRLEKKAAALA